MDPNLVHSSGKGPAQNNTGAAVVIQPFEFCPALFSTWWNLADSNLVTHNFYWLGTFSNTPVRKKIKIWMMVLEYIQNMFGFFAILVIMCNQ